ncbi:uncharacterized protein LOC123541000 [Mercenaria mercenaria]|uniref:uncharacterized protein LOC123541000 n=1 Tax=Mercenaria mercenaria TaxID=6596 RepID=UPI00234F64E4|nr:uncharacterized protein LOC123541000 [Mercenaria mercenaria]
MTHDLDLSETTYGTEYTVSLSGMVELRTKIDYISVNNVFVMDMGVKICWDRNTCAFHATILNRTVISTPVCDWDKGFNVKDFSLATWKTDHNLGPADNIEGLLSDQLFEHLKLSQYLLSRCNASDANALSKTTECSLNLPRWFEKNKELECGFQDSCSNITCCLFSKSLGRSFSINVDVRSCEFKMFIAIEKFRKEISLIDYKWGISERVSLFGIVTLTYSIYDVPAENAFIINMQLSVCSDETSTCLFDETVLDFQRVKKESCDWKLASIDSDFNLTNWMQFRGLDFGSYSVHGRHYLMEKLGIDRLLLQPSCNMNEKIYEYSECSATDISSQLLPIAACRLSAECMNLECCLDTPDVNQRFKFQFIFDPCNYKYAISIDKFTFENNLFNVDLTTAQMFSLLGVVSVRYRIEDLAIDGLYKVNLRIKICFDKSTCPVDLQILNDTQIPKPHCFMKLKQEYNIKDFSLRRWLNRYSTNLSVSPLSQNVAAILMSDLGITEYMESNYCAVGMQPFNHFGWDRGECLLNVTIPDANLQNISCTLLAKCTSASCCIPIPLIGRNVKVNLDVDPCALTMNVGVERLNYSLSLIDYEFGRQEYIWLAGVLRLTFSIHDLASRNEYLISLKYEECWESHKSCSNEYKILENQRLPKQICKFTDSYNIPEFSLSTWMTDNGLNKNDVLNSQQQKYLLADLGLGAYLKENICILKNTPTKLYLNGWINECSKTVQLPSLHDGIQCTLSDYCTSVSCCVALQQIGYNLQVDLDIDPCKQMLSIHIERMKNEIALIDYKYGAFEDFWLFGIAQVRYQVYDLHEERKYQLNLNISICLESHLPCQNFSVFQNTKLHKVKCDWGTKTETSDEFSISNWMSNFKEDINDISSLPTYALDTLYNDMGVADFLSQSQCAVGIHPFSVKGGINNECTRLSKPLSPLGQVSCHLSSTCMSLECCIDTDILPRTIHTFLQVNACEQTLAVGIEKFTFEMDLVSYDFGTPEHFWLQKIFRIDFRLFDLKEENAYVLDFDISVCLESGIGCTLMQTVLSQALLPKPQCGLKEGFKIDNFSMVGWLSKHGYAHGDVISDLDHSALMSDIGLPRYLLLSECKLSNISDNNATSVCALSRHIATLPRQLSCYLSTCNDVQCCLSVEPLGRNFMISFSVDPCRQLLSVAIEEFKTQMSLNDFEWNKEHEIYFKGIIRLMFVLDNLVGENAFVLSLDVKACLESKGACYFEKNVFNRVKFSKRLCEYSVMSSFPIKEFSLLEWKLHNNLPTDLPLESPLSDILLDDLGLLTYLNEIQCELNHTKHNAGWINNCPYINTKILPQILSCTLDSTCSKLECCVSVEAINRNVQFEYDINVCESTVEVSVEKLQLKRSFFDFYWGKPKRLNFGGIVRLDFSFTDLPNEKKILSSTSISVCFESTSSCALQTTVLDELLFPKELCEWNKNFVLKDFSLQRWISHEGLIQGIPLNQYYASKLLEELNLSPFLMKDYYIKDLSRNMSWTFDCPRSVSTGMNNLPYNMQCVIGQSCTAVECYVGVEILNRTFKTQVNIDSCAHQITFAVEKYQHSKQLFNYTWGQTEHTWLFGVIRMSVSVYNLGGEGKYVVNLNISVCLEAHASCQTNVQVLENAVLPKLNCDWNADFADPDFDMNVWYRTQGLSPGTDLTEKYTHILYNDLNLSPYIGKPCLFNNNTFNISEAGWANECPYDVDLPQLPDSTKCRVPTFCTGIECCTEVNLVRRHIRTYIFLHTCLGRLEIGIEKMKYTLDLNDFEFGTEKSVSLQGVFRLRFVIEDLRNEGVLLMTLEIDVCFSAKQTCMENIKILKNTKLRKPVCDMSTGYKITDFSMQNWLKNKGLVAGNIGALQLSMLYEELGLSTYLKGDACNIPKNSTSWKRDCSLNIDLPDLPDNVFCTISKTCNAIDCCLKSKLLQRIFAVSLKVDQCKMVLTAVIEKVTFEIPLLVYEWGLEKDFDLFGVIRMRYSVDDLHIGGKYILNVQMAVCLESRDQCETIVSVLNNTLLTKTPCDLDPGFVVQNFSLSSWLTTKGYPLKSYLGDDVTAELLEVLGIVGYLNETQCERKSPTYTPSAYGWKRSCSLGVNVSPLQNILTCALQESCSAVDCCIDVYLLEKSFNVKFNLNPCTNMLEIGIERLTFDLPLEDYISGSQSRFCLYGVICLDYSIKDLTWSGIYIVDLKLSICFDSSTPCHIESQIFKSTVLPKKICDWEDANLIQNFTLSDWYSKRGFVEMKQLPSYIAAALENDIGLSMYLSDVECNRNQAPYLSNSSDCSSDCPLQIHSSVYDDMSCYIPDYCTAVDLCVYVPLINRNIHAYLRLHACDALLDVGIEQFKFSVGLFDYEFGNDDEVNLKDVFKLRFRIDDLATRGVFVVNLEFSICFINSSCENTYVIFDRTVLPKLPCSWDLGFRNESFSVTKWMSDRHITKGEVTDVQRKELFETLGLAAYLEDNACYLSEQPYSPSANGWNTDCPAKLTLKPLSSGIGCYISNMCTAVQCCLELDIVQTSVQFYVTVDGCEKQLTVGIEQMETVKDLRNYQFGSWDRFYLYGVYRIDYLIENFQGGRKYVMDMNISACFESDGECANTIPVLQKTILPKVKCDWLNGFTDDDFSLTSWKSDKGVSKSEQLSPTLFDLLASDLGISQYLKDEECKLSSVRPLHGWKNLCPLNANVSILPNNMECIMGLTCLTIDCCLFVSDLNRSFSVSLHVDDCDYQISASIENLIMERKLSAFEFGKRISFDMDGLISMRFMVVNLEYTNKYILDLDVDVHFEARKLAASSTKVLDDLLVPRIPCQVNSGFITKDFSLDKWKDVTNVSVIDDYQSVRLLEDIAISPFLHPNRCTVHDGSEIDTSLCPMDVEVLHFYGSASCSLTELCSGISCCLDSSEVAVNFIVEVQINACKEEVVVALEKLKYIIPFRNLTWGELQTFSLFGVIRLEMTISETIKSQIYSLNLKASICLGENETCNTEYQVLKNAYLTALPCDWSSGFLDKDFNYEEWRNQSHYGQHQLPETGVAFYLSKIGVEPYLKHRMCDSSAFPYIPSPTSGWTSDCRNNASVQALPDDTRCFMVDTCSGFECCSYIDELQRSFHVQLKLDPCSQTLAIGIERILQTILLTKFEWGVLNKFYLNGLIRLDYSITSLPIKRIYVANVNLSICLDQENCKVEMEILKNDILPQTICEWNPDYTEDAFSLKQWKEDKNISKFGGLDDVEQIELMTNLGIYQYLRTPECSELNGTNSEECGVTPDFPSSCSLSKNCARISCCVYSDVLQRRIFYELDYDRCNHLVNLSIETFSRTVSLYDFEYGKEMTMSLYSALQIKFMIDYLVISRSHIISLNISECYESSGPCSVVLEVLNDDKFSSEDCPINKNYKNEEFSLTEWSSERNLNYTELPTYARKVLHRDLGISQYLQQNECIVESYNDSYGWNSECAENITLLNITDEDASISCNLQTSCSNLDCCFYVDEIQKTFKFQFLFDPCKLKLTVGIEKLVYEVPLKEAVTGHYLTMSMNGFIRMEFMIDDNSNNEYVINLRLKICMESAFECNRDIEILRGLVVKRECDFGSAFENPGFSLAVWETNNAVTSGYAMTDKQRDLLMQHLGLEHFLLKEPCKLRTNTAEDGFDTCVRTKTGESFDCCVESKILGRNLWMNFTMDACNYHMEMNLENLQQKHLLLNYEWRTLHSISTKGVWHAEYMVTNVQSERVFSLDISLQQCFEPNCTSRLIVANDVRIPYPSCQNVTRNDTRQPFYGISYDFWKQPICTTDNYTVSTVCDPLPAELQNICTWAPDCSGIQCCTEFYFNAGKRNVMIHLSLLCNDGKLQYGIENKIWNRPLSNLEGPIHEVIADTIYFDMNVSTAAPSRYKISLTISVCTGTQDTFGCQLNFRLSQTTKCPGHRRRRRRSVTEAISLGMDIKEAVTLLMSHGTSPADIQKFVEDAIEYQKVQKAEVWQGEQLSDSDSSTGYAATVKALGENNPQTLKHRSSELSVQVEVKGADKILDMIGSANDIVSRADQLFVVGKGLSKEGTKLLGAQLANMTIGDLEAMLEVNKVDPTMIGKLVHDFIDLAKALYSEVVDKLFSGELGNPFKSFDLSLKGQFVIPKRSVRLFKFDEDFMLGGFITLTFSFGADGYYGLNLGWEGKLIAKTAGATVVPYGGLTCYGEMGIGFVMYGKLRLEGQIMDLRFPTRAEIGFSKFPLDVALKMDLELTPVKLKLIALVTLEVKLLFVKIKKILYSKDLWHYKTPTIRKTIIDVSTKEKDESPPQFSPVVSNENNRGKRSMPACDISQIKNRDYTEPAFEISVAAADDRSNVKFFLDVGTFPAGSNIVNDRQLGGSSTVLATAVDEYPSGVPLYFTVYAENSAGARAGVTCMLTTYDTTEPTARITPAFLSTSNPNEIKASVLVHDDSEIIKAFTGVGYGKGSYGDQVVPWTLRNLKERTTLSTSGDPLKQFSDLQDGKFVSPPIKTLNEIPTATSCAQTCLALGHCVSFNYDYSPAGTCELLRSIRQFDDTLAQSGLFSHFERLSSGHSVEVNHNDLNLQHNRLHFVNTDLKNVLGYRSIIPSAGILTDYTCPEPGPIVNSSRDSLSIDDCLSLIPPDRPDLNRFCIGIYSKRLNHRTIIDGEGSRTVFNGDKPVLDLKYTRSNNYIAGNWDGITDDETGIRAYALAVGRHICEDSIHPHHDPHKHLMHESQWTNMAIMTATADYNPFPLESGKYYLTVRAINKVEYGGPLATTICHSVPYIIDITNPVVYEVFDIKYDEDRYMLSAEHNSTDIESGLDSVELCIGDNPRNCELLSWTRRPKSQYINYTHHIPDGIPAWIRLRVTNNVELHSVGRADQAIIVDASPPLAGTVYDGPLFKDDLQFTKYSKQICLNWYGFYDPESGISSYEIGVGTSAGLTDIAELKTLKHQEHSYCVSLDENSTLIHNNVYYPVVWANNGAVNQKNISGTSDGVRVDLTKPVKGKAVDGNINNLTDVQYSSSKSTVQLQWDHFYDPESGIREYDVQIARRRHGSDWATIKEWSKFGKHSKMAEWRNFHLNHNDEVKSTVKAANGALNDVETETDGFIVDLTSPLLEHLNDGSVSGKDIEFQVNATEVHVNFKFYDPESGIKQLRYQLHEQQHGTTRQFYPGAKGKWIEISDVNATQHKKSGLKLTVGHRYISRLVAINGAGLLSTYETNGFIIENTPPKISWIRVGVLSGLEHLIDGYVYQSDHNGIKVCWSASDPQSGINAIQYSVGTTKGSTDVLPWTETEISSSSAYLPCSLNNTDTDGSTEPVYYVSLKARNGAGLWSTVANSSPIIVVPEDVTGTVHDGPYEHLKDDIDYQADAHTVTMRFSGFESSLHGIMAFDWAIGTSPGTEDVQPYLEDGIIHNEEDDVSGNGLTSSGYAQTVVDLDHGGTYFTTLRATTNKGDILQATTNGFIVDTTPPDIMFNKLSKSTAQDSDVVIYQKDQSVLAATWNFSDSEHLFKDSSDNIDTTWFSVGSVPYADDIYNRTYQNVSSDNEGTLPVGHVRPALAGTTNLVSVGVKNKAGLEKMIVSPPVVQDNIAPLAGTVECPKFVQSHFVIECTWTGFVDKESEIKKYYITFGSKQGYDDLLLSEEIPGQITRFSAKDVVKDHNDKIYATVTAENRVGLSVRAYSKVIVVDNTPPSPGVVVELSSVARVNPNDVDKTVEMNRKACSSKEECLKIDAVCTEAFTHLGVAWTHFSDDESEITEYQLAIGTSPGGAEISPFIPLSSELNHYVVKNIDLKGLRQVFATIKASNFAGLTTSAYSNGVYLSYLSQGLPPLEHIGIYDANQHSVGDVEFQSDTNSIEAKWDVSGDPCPVVKFEWSVEETDGTVLQHFIDMYTSTSGRTDQLDLKEGRRYYSLVRVRNMLGFVYTLRSDGVTINSNPMLPGMVYDGDVTGYDLKVLSSRTMVSANWDGFGKLRQSKGVSEILTGNKGVDEGEETDPDQEVAYYEVALGSDRRFDKTRDNVVPFTNVGKNTSVTFKDLDLEPGFAVYYFTVRAFSASSASATITSNGFFVSFDGGVSAGTITLPDFINSNKTLDVQWNGYTSNVGIMLYYVAISDHQNTSSGDCRRYVDGGKATDTEKHELFNVYQVTSVGVSTYLYIDDLMLVQNSTYFLWIMGVDKAGECNMTYHSFTVDVTKPENGKITAGPYFNMALAYTRYRSEIHMKWEGFHDGESGIEEFSLELWHGGRCSAANTQTLIKTVEVFGNYTEYRFTNLSIERFVVYLVKIKAVNRAKLITSAETSPVVFDDSMPTAGHVSEGSVFINDIVWWGFTDHIKGTLLHSAVHVNDPCPLRNISMSDSGWSPVEIKRLNDPDGVEWKIQHREANIRTNTYNDEVSIKISRDSKAERIYSAAYMRSADMKDGGTYELSIRAADGDGMAVTGVTFWDGDDGDLHIFNHRTKTWNELGSCSCCLESNTTDCLCNCTEYLNTLNMHNGTVNENTTEYNTSYISGGSRVISQQSCGIQIYEGKEPYIVTWCKFFNNTGQSMSVRSELHFSPSEEFHHYRIKFFIVKEDITATICINVFADENQISEMCGIPPLSIHTKLILHVWNKDNIVPTLDVFNLWQATADFKGLIMPPDINALCRYGDPIQGGTNAIVKYEAGIGTTPGAVDIVPFQVVNKPCIPCTDACSQFDCEHDCKFNGYTLVHFTIKDTAINATYDKTLYISVKAVLGSGANAVSSSNGFYIDITSPVFDEEVMMYIDVRQGEFTPSDFQGSNNTIKALWLCNDDRSEIAEYKWAIGTEVGLEDIQSYTSTGTFSTGTNNNLEGQLKHNSSYYVSVKCTNAAGLTTVWEDKKGVTVLLEAPDPDSVTADAVGAKHFDKEVYPPTAVKSKDPSTCGESWTVSTDPNIRRYDFCVGSSMETIDDIIPCVWVGYNMSGVVEIKNGYLFIDNTPYRKVSELRALSKGVYDYSTANTDDNTFRMESGRTLFLFMRLCNKAEICIDKFVNSLLITDEKSVLLSSESGKGERFQLKDSQTGRVKRSSLETSIEMPEGTEKGQSILYNKLTEENMTARYDSAASTTFKSYIVNPEDTLNKTERLLYRRIHSFNQSFTLSPVGQKPFPAPLKLTYPNTNVTDDADDTIIMVVHWNPDHQQWQITNSTCSWDNVTVDEENNDLSSILICDTRLSADTRTENQTYFAKETQFALATVSSKIVNNPPKFMETSITMDEDSDDTQFQLIAKDMENDPFVYSRLAETYVFGNVTLNTEGILTLSLCKNCYGNSSVKFSLEDKPSWDDIVPAQADYSVDIEILPLNDPPIINAFSRNGTNILPNDPTEPILIFKEQTGKTISEIAAVVIAYDIDGPQNLQMISNTTIASSSFYLKDVDRHEILDLMPCNHAQCESPDVISKPSTAEWKGVSINYTQENTSFIGLDTIKVVAQDENGIFSDVVSVTLVVMENKCQHGQCKSLNPRQYSCNDTRRAGSFDLYYTCECPGSWEGPYCGQDVDECARGFCEAWKVCDNKIGGYDCYCKATDIICKLSLEVWEFSIIVTAVVLVLVVLLAVFIVRKCKSKKYKMKKVHFDKENSRSSISLTALLKNARTLGPGRPHLAKVAPLPLDKEEDNGETDTSVPPIPPISTFLTSFVHADVHKADNNSEDDGFVHPAPKFDRTQLVAEFEQRKEELEAMDEIPEDDMHDHPPPELSQSHLVTKYSKNAVAPLNHGKRKFRSEFKLFSALSNLERVDDSSNNMKEHMDACDDEVNPPEDTKRDVRNLKDTSNINLEKPVGSLDGNAQEEN